MPSLVSPVLVGRQAELQSLADAVERVVAGEQITVLIGGEAGVGKSRLVQELIARTRDAEIRVLVGGCVELDGGGIPFAPVVEMIRTLASELPDGELDAVLGPARSEIGRLVPELGDDRLTAPAGEPDPSRMLELLVGVVGRLAAAEPLLLWFEDVQWADRSTLDLLALLVARGGRHLLVVLTVRSDELHRGHPFRRMSARWDQQRLVERLELERLAPSSVAAQIEAILGERPDRELVEFVSERSEGIPLFVEELLGAVRDGRVDHDYLPPSCATCCWPAPSCSLRADSTSAGGIGGCPLGPRPPTRAGGRAVGRRAARCRTGGGGAAVAGGRRVRALLRLSPCPGSRRHPRRSAARRARTAAPGLRPGDRGQPGAGRRRPRSSGRWRWSSRR